MKTARIIIIALLLFVGVNALIAGYLFMRDPSGSKLGLSIDLLEYTPFENFLLPGIVLFLVNGLFNVVAVLYTFFQWNGWKFLVLLQGLTLFGWIVIQVILLHQLHYLHFIFASIGVILILFGIAPSKKINHE